MFEIKAKAVAKAEMPELDEAFFAQFGVEDGELVPSGRKYGQTWSVSFVTPFVRE